MPAVPRYREIANDLRARIAAGDFPVDAMLPSIKELQLYYRVPGQNTIRRAQAILLEEGLIRIEQGRGTFVIAVPEDDDLDAVRAMVSELEAIISKALEALERVQRRVETMAEQERSSMTSQ